MLCFLSKKSHFLYHLYSSNNLLYNNINIIITNKVVHLFLIFRISITHFFKYTSSDLLYYIIAIFKTNKIVHLSLILQISIPCELSWSNDIFPFTKQASKRGLFSVLKFHHNIFTLLQFLSLH